MLGSRIILRFGEVDHRQRLNASRFVFWGVELDTKKTMVFGTPDQKFCGQYLPGGVVRVQINAAYFL